MKMERKRNRIRKKRKRRKKGQGEKEEQLKENVSNKIKFAEMNSDPTQHTDEPILLPNMFIISLSFVNC